MKEDANQSKSSSNPISKKRDHKNPITEPTKFHTDCQTQHEASLECEKEKPLHPTIYAVFLLWVSIPTFARDFLMTSAFFVVLFSSLTGIFNNYQDKSVCQPYFDSYKVR